MDNMEIKVLVISADYPSPDNIYGDVFVHTRLKEYQKIFAVEVVGYNTEITSDLTYTYEDISVRITSDLSRFYTWIGESDPDVIIGHLVRYQYLDFLLSVKKPLILFFHGYDTTSWKRRLMNYQSPGALPYLWKYLRSNRKQMRVLRQFIKASADRPLVHFVYVSGWLLQAARHDLGLKIPRTHIIPNGIDTFRFASQSKDPSLRKKLLLLRSFRAYNYANDVAVEVILLLSKKDFFNDLQFSIYGDGYLFKPLTDRIKHFSNVTINNFFVENKDIPGIHAAHGIFLCPSRLDTQGVSMCEAMSSGLIPVTNPIGGIPEYVENRVSGFLLKTALEMAEEIENLYNNPDVFTAMSKAARKAVEDKCAMDKVISKEINLIQQLTNRS